MTRIAFLAVLLITVSNVARADPLAGQPGNYVPPPSYSHWIYWTPQLHRLRVEHHAPPLQSWHTDPPTPAPFRVLCYPKQPVAPGALFHPSSTPFQRVEQAPTSPTPTP